MTAMTAANTSAAAMPVMKTEEDKSLLPIEGGALEGKVFGAVLLLFGSTWSSVRAVSGSVTEVVGSVGTILATVG